MLPLSIPCNFLQFPCNVLCNRQLLIFTRGSGASLLDCFLNKYIKLSCNLHRNYIKKGSKWDVIVRLQTDPLEAFFRALSLDRHFLEIGKNSFVKTRFGEDLFDGRILTPVFIFFV